MFGQKILSTTFKDAVVDAALDKINVEEMFPTRLASRVYPVSESSSTIRKLVVDIAVWKYEPGDLEKHPQSKSHCRFFVDVAVATTERYERKLKDPFYTKKIDACKYHEHVAKGTPCWKTLFGR